SPRTRTPARSRTQLPKAGKNAAMPRVIDESVSSEAYRAIDQMREALSAHLTGGLSPASLALALIDWYIHLAAAPGKRLELLDTAVRKAARRSTYVAAARAGPETPPCIEPLPGDYRFKAPAWTQQP